MKRLLISALAVAALATGAARAGTAYTDPVGDQLNSPSLVAPDITAVEVSNTPEGLVTFAITIAGSQPLSRFSGVAIALDLDRDSSTGDEGAEAFIGYIVDLLGAGRLAFDRWDGSELVEVEQTTATARFADGVVTITVPRASCWAPEVSPSLSYRSSRTSPRSRSTSRPTRGSGRTTSAFRRLRHPRSLRRSRRARRPSRVPGSRSS
jgi:hypothetical protein